MNQKTILLKPAEVQSTWWVVDAKDQVVGRLAVQIARVLMGKHRPDYTPHVACGDFVVIINAEKVKFTGKKWAQQTYEKYTGYQSGRRVINATEMLAKNPTLIMHNAVRRMLPKSKLGYTMISRLKVYAGDAHPHAAQQPKPFPAG